MLTGDYVTTSWPSPYFTLADSGYAIPASSAIGAYDRARAATLRCPHRKGQGAGASRSAYLRAIVRAHGWEDKAPIIGSPVL